MQSLDCFIEKSRPYRAVISFRLGYKN